MAVKLYGMAVKQGDPNAMCGLGALYAEGQGVDQSYEKANELYKMAADRGHATAQFNVGNAYARGDPGVEQSYETAREWWTKAAAQGHADDAIEWLAKLDAMEGKTPPPSTTPTPLLCSTCGTPETPDRHIESMQTMPHDSILQHSMSTKTLGRRWSQKRM